MILNNFFTAQLDDRLLTINLPNLGFYIITFDDLTDVRQIINVVLNQLSQGQPVNRHFYALRLKHMLTKEVI